MSGYWNLIEKSEVNEEFEKNLTRAIEFLSSRPNNDTAMNDIIKEEQGASS